MGLKVAINLFKAVIITIVYGTALFARVIYDKIMYYIRLPLIHVILFKTRKEYRYSRDGIVYYNVQDLARIGGWPFFFRLVWEKIKRRRKNVL